MEASPFAADPKQASDVFVVVGQSGTQNAENQEIPGVRALTPEHHSFILVHAEESTLVVVPMADLIFITVERRPDTDGDCATNGEYEQRDQSPSPLGKR